ncbi:MAG: hypothetical protein S4CHLAM2_01540 [Chlamydiales bacterium]|nr:hypothetical protein [Chlamydiales bacterium]
MIFEDREDAGRRLATALNHYQSASNTIVIALPRGGIVVGFEIATALQLPLDIVCPRKIGAPSNEEYAIGAVTETGETIIFGALNVSEKYLQETIEQETKEAQKHLDRYRTNYPPRQLKDKRVILVDDGLATGATMRAAIKTVRTEKAKEIVMAIPVAPPDTLAQLEKEVDQAICLLTPMSFFAVGQFYKKFEQTTDEKVISLLKRTCVTGAKK